ncbi:MAG: family 20 glycosylhydrolase [Ilumatobacter fluminis]|uniref:beta-N-acetylhexosaminidase n=1 Tax=Ilumatobacter fluminis TaxID=467091 RepID=UPI0032EB17F3
MTAAGTLWSSYDDIARRVTLRFEAAIDLDAGWQLAFTSLQQLTPIDSDAVELVEQLASYHLVTASEPASLAAGASWAIGECEVSHQARHANDGPASSYVVTADGSTIAVDVVPMTGPPALATARPSVHDLQLGDTPDDRPALLPYPSHVAITDGSRTSTTTARLAAFDDGADVAWRAIEALTTRRGRPVLTDDGIATVSARLDARLGASAYRILVDGTSVEVTAGDIDGFRYAFVTLAQWLPSGLPAAARVVDRPRYAWRGVHLDVARQWFEPDVVERLIDDAAWRKLSRLHLHLTDDEAWRLPVPAHPALTEIGGRRGHGLPVPPLLGSGADPTGRGYTPDEIGRWVRRADELGVVLVPEIDLPGHLHAARVAMPQLRDPDDTSEATSVQYFVDNVLVPGAPATRRFITDVVDAVAELFPSSPWIHVGGDEVPDGAWSGSPIAREWARANGLSTTNEIEAAIHREVVEAIRERTGRAVGAWEEAARTRGAVPGDGYVVGWQSIDINRELAARGFDVVIAPGQAYYLDMAENSAWETPGMSWAGATSLADVCAFDPESGWSPAERAHIVGLQACLWTEYVHDEAALRDRLFPRLDAIAERSWTGSIVGGPSSVDRRSAAIR